MNMRHERTTRPRGFWSRTRVRPLLGGRMGRVVRALRQKRPQEAMRSVPAFTRFVSVLMVAVFFVTGDNLMDPRGHRFQRGGVLVGWCRPDRFGYGRLRRDVDVGAEREFEREQFRFGDHHGIAECGDLECCEREDVDSRFRWHPEDVGNGSFVHWHECDAFFDGRHDRHERGHDIGRDSERCDNGYRIFDQVGSGRLDLDGCEHVLGWDDGECWESPYREQLGARNGGTDCEWGRGFE